MTHTKSLSRCANFRRCRELVQLQLEACQSNVKNKSTNVFPFRSCQCIFLSERSGNANSPLQ